MKKLLLTLFAITLFSGILKAQDRATTWDEYNYLKQGNYSYILPGHVVRPSNIKITLNFDFTGSRSCQILELYREGQNNPCALVLVFRVPDDGSGGNIPVPDINSEPCYVGCL